MARPPRPPTPNASRCCARPRTSMAVTIAPIDPRGVVLHALGELFAPDRDRAAIRGMLSSRSAAFADTMEFSRAQRNIIAGLTRQELPVEVGADLLFSNVRVNVEGDDAGGYRVRLRAAGETQSFFVVREDDAVPHSHGGAAAGARGSHGAGTHRCRRLRRRATLARLGAARDQGLRTPKIRSMARHSRVPGPWEWKRTCCARAWRPHCCWPTAHWANARCRCCSARAMRRTTPSDRLSLDLALGKVYLELSRWPQLGEVAGRLQTAVPTSALAFRYQQWAGIQLQQWDAVEQASRRAPRAPAG